MSQEETRERIDRFIRELEKRADPKTENRADLARLRRCAGRGLEDCGDVMSLFYGMLPHGVGRRDEELYFLVATLFPSAPGKWRGEGSRDLGVSLRALAGKEGVNADGVDRRLSVLLDADREALPFRLRQAVTMLGQKEVPVDWRRLLADLLAWEWSSRPVQKQWARSYYGVREEAPAEGGDETAGAGAPEPGEAAASVPGTSPHA